MSVPTTGSSACRQRALAGAGVVVGLALWLGSVGGPLAAGKAAGPVWQRAVEVALPADAVATKGQQSVELEAVTCTSAGNCVAVGDYLTGPALIAPLVVSETGGVWGQAITVATPSPSSGPTSAGFNSVACMSIGNCVAVGDYADGVDGQSQAMVASEVNGVWGPGSRLALPANAGTNADSLPQAQLDSVTCNARGTCVAVGGYTDSVGRVEAMVVRGTDGNWSRPSEVKLPVGATELPQENSSASLDSVVCTGTGNCVAVGYYTDDVYENRHASRAMVVRETGDKWARAQKLPTSPPSDITVSELGSVACTDPGECVAIGSYMTKGEQGGSRSVVVTETHGRWGQPTPLGGSSFGAHAVTCPVKGSCVVVGSSESASPAGVDLDNHAATVTETNGTWPRKATAVTLPTDARAPERFSITQFESVACTSRSQCVAVGIYGNTNEETEAMATSTRG